MNCQGQQLGTWHLMYNKLINDYSTLALHYHQQSESNFTLYQQLENLLQEKISILQEAPSPLMPTLPFLPSSHQVEDTPPAPKKRKTKGSSKKIVRRHGIKRNGDVYRCTYPECTRTYRSSVSMNLHIKINHNGGTKKQRQACAKMLIDSQQKGVHAPSISLNLPPNFLNEFKKNYSYIKKYNM